MLEKKFTIYLRRNLMNDKCYVGQTCNFNGRKKQWRCLKYTYTNKYIDEDRLKFGLDAWSVEVLATTDNQEDAWEIEQRFIKDYNTIWPNGYNLAKGGGGRSCKHSEKAKQKMSDAKPKKQVYQYTLDGELVKIWPSTAECGRNGFNSGHISQCCNGKKKKYKGYRWSYTPLQ